MLTIPFGKYRGHRLDGVPADYLRWATNNLERLSPSLKIAMRDELTRRDAEPQRMELPIAKTNTATTTDHDITAVTERASQTLEWFEDRIQDLRDVLASGEWTEDEQLDLPLLVCLTGALGVCVAHLDPVNVTKNAERLRQQRRT
jgi:Putative quorum-sensing-regulated virulence factor